jgi:hypothetical protein
VSNLFRTATEIRSVSLETPVLLITSQKTEGFKSGQAGSHDNPSSKAQGSGSTGLSPGKYHEKLKYPDLLVWGLAHGRKGTNTEGKVHSAL